MHELIKFDFRKPTNCKKSIPYSVIGV